MKNFLVLLMTLSATTSFAFHGGNSLKYKSVVDIGSNKGSTFFSIMKDQVKPSLDRYATQGFQVATGEVVLEALKNVDPKVSSKAIHAAGGTEQLKQLADLLSKSGPINFYNLPDAIAKAGYGAGRFDLSTFLALASGGGVAVKINDDNYAYNVNYGTGKTEKDEMTGRSYGEAPSRPALDASDAHYLQMLESYVRTDKDNVGEFYKSILDILINNDTSHYARITPAGQAVATDFLAVYVAEQNRHLMADLKSHHWDDALLEVTLLSALHSGQSQLKVMYNGKLTATTLKQASGCTAAEARVSKPASMVDYWQFSTNPDPAQCNRSGINVTRRDFNALGLQISNFHRAHHPALVQKVEAHFKVKNANLFAALSQFLINYQTPSRLTGADLQLADDFTAFLMQVRADADLTSNEIAASQPAQ